MKESVSESSNIVANISLRDINIRMSRHLINLKILASKFELHPPVTCDLVVLKLSVILLSIRPCFHTSSVDLTIQDFSFINFSRWPFKSTLTRRKTLLPLSIIDCPISKSFYPDPMLDVIQEASFVCSSLIIILSKSFNNPVLPRTFIILSWCLFSVCFAV